MSVETVGFTKSDVKKRPFRVSFFCFCMNRVRRNLNKKNPAYAGFPLYPRRFPNHFFLLFSMINRTMPAINAAEPVMIARRAIGDLSPVFTL